MRKTAELWIDGQLADIGDEELVLLTFKQTDMTAPAAVYNSYSQQLTLPPTPGNHRIFKGIGRADHHTTSTSFNALTRVPFAIYNDLSEVVESGYVKLDSIGADGYHVSLFGGLGSFLYGLMYNADGTKKSLADLDFGTSLTFDIDRDAIRAAWRKLGGYSASTMWDIINFAPCYNGIPEGEFDAKKALCPTTCYGIVAPRDGHGPIRGHALCDLADEVDEWAASDLRSYLQRPVINMRKVLEAIFDSGNNGGYSVSLDANWFDSNNPYWSRAWLTLPMLGGITLPSSSESGYFTFGGGAVYALNYQTYSKTFTDASVLRGDYNGEYDISLTFIPTLRSSSVPINAVAAWETHDLDNSRMGERAAILYQLVALDSDGNVIGGSQVAVATTKALSLDGQPLLQQTIEGGEFVRQYNNALGTRWHTYAPAWNPSGDDTTYVTYTGERFNGLTNGNLLDANGDNVRITLKITGVTAVASFRLDITPIGVEWQGFSQASLIRYYQSANMDWTKVDGTSQTGITGMSFSVQSNHCPYRVVRSGTVHSGASVTQDMLLGGTATPADYLLSYIKMFGLYITVDKGTKNVSIMQRNSFFDGETISLEGHVDVPSISMQPYSVTSRWYDFEAPVEGAFADYYRSAYGKTYGGARVNTGFQFNADHNDVMKDNVFRGAVEILARNKYFCRVSEQTKPMPSPFLDGGKYTLWNGAGENEQYDIQTATSQAAVEYVNPTYPGYDLSFMPKPQFCDKDGKAVDGHDVLLFFDGTTDSDYYDRFCITDDNSLMTQLNDGTPCWLLGQHTLEDNEDYVIGDGMPMPRFHRFRDALGATVVNSMEYGTPQEVDNPGRTVGANVNVYHNRWASYFADLMDVDSRVMTCKVRLGGLGQVGASMLRHFWWYAGALWVLTEIRNYAPASDELTTCVFVKVKDTTNYTNGQS